MVKHRPFMYKKCKKAFEILRSEITFLMDLYIYQFILKKAMNDILIDCYIEFLITSLEYK